MSTTTHDPAPDATSLPGSPQAQLDALIEAERTANAQQPRNFKGEALTDKIVSVEPDGTGPTSTKTFNTEVDRRAGSGDPKA